MTHNRENNPYYLNPYNPQCSFDAYGRPITIVYNLPVLQPFPNPAMNPYQPGQMQYGQQPFINPPSNPYQPGPMQYGQQPFLNPPTSPYRPGQMQYGQQPFPPPSMNPYSTAATQIARVHGVASGSQPLSNNTSSLSKIEVEDITETGTTRSIRKTTYTYNDKSENTSDSKTNLSQQATVSARTGSKAQTQQKEAHAASTSHSAPDATPVTDASKQAPQAHKTTHRGTRSKNTSHSVPDTTQVTEASKQAPQAHKKLFLSKGTYLKNTWHSASDAIHVTEASKQAAAAYKTALRSKEAYSKSASCSAPATTKITKASRQKNDDIEMFKNFDPSAMNTSNMDRFIDHYSHPCRADKENLTNAINRVNELLQNTSAPNYVNYREFHPCLLSTLLSIHNVSKLEREGKLAQDTYKIFDFDKWLDNAINSFSAEVSTHFIKSDAHIHSTQSYVALLSKAIFSIGVINKDQLYKLTPKTSFFLREGISQLITIFQNPTLFEGNKYLFHLIEGLSMVDHTDIDLEQINLLFSLSLERFNSYLEKTKDLGIKKPCNHLKIVIPCIDKLSSETYIKAPESIEKFLKIIVLDHQLLIAKVNKNKDYLKNIKETAKALASLKEKVTAQDLKDALQLTKDTLDSWIKEWEGEPQSLSFKAAEDAHGANEDDYEEEQEETQPSAEGIKAEEPAESDFSFPENTPMPQSATDETGLTGDTGGPDTTDLS